MLAFILRRLAQAVIVMLAVGLIAFSLFRFVGDPVLFMLGQDATDEQRAQVTRDLGLDRPFYVQYARFVANAVQGEFGLSLRQVQPVSKLFVERLPATLELSFVAALLALALGIPMGIYTALRPRFVAVARAARGVARRRLAADLPHRHPADPGVLGAARLAAVVRPRRHGGRSAGGAPACSPPRG